MNYKKHYEKLINRSKNRVINGYTENHHIIPKCMGGTDGTNNIATLTAREHFVAHLLLVKIHPKQYGLINAVKMMCMFNRNQDRSANRMYGWIRERFSVNMSIQQSGKNNSQYGKIWIYSDKLKKSQKIEKIELTKWVDEGWKKGRKIIFKNSHKKLTQKMRKFYKSANKQTQSQREFILFLESEHSTILHFANDVLEQSDVAVIYRWRKYLPFYKDIFNQGTKNTKEMIIKKYGDVTGNG